MNRPIHKGVDPWGDSLQHPAELGLPKSGHLAVAVEDKEVVARGILKPGDARIDDRVGVGSARLCRGDGVLLLKDGWSGRSLRE